MEGSSLALAPEPPRAPQGDGLRAVLPTLDSTRLVLAAGISGRELTEGPVFFEAMSKRSEHSLDNM